MHLATHYAPGSYLKPCLVVDTVFNAKTKETSLRFVEALDADHASELAYRPTRNLSDSLKDSGWIVVRQHSGREEALRYHLALTEHFHNGGSDEEWAEGWEPYLALWKAHCPAKLKKERA